MEEDHPLIRASATCPLCGGEKPVGNLVCWPCYREHGLRYGNPEVERRLDEAEAVLDAEAMIPPRPWGYQVREGYIAVGSLEEDGTIGEVVFSIDLDGAHAPVEEARARFIVDTVNKAK